jgi:uncharacterized membrane protein
MSDLERRHVVLLVMVFHVIYQIHFFMTLSFNTIQPLETRTNYIKTSVLVSGLSGENLCVQMVKLISIQAVFGICIPWIAKRLCMNARVMGYSTRTTWLSCVD